MRFKLKEKVGKHTEDGTVYKAGDVIETHRDLAKAFPEKFERVGGRREDPPEDDTALAGTVVKDTPNTKRALDPDDEDAPAPRAARAGFAPRADASVNKKGKGKKGAAKGEDDFNAEREEE